MWITNRPAFCAIEKDHFFQFVLDFKLKVGILLHFATRDKNALEVKINATRL